MSISGWQLVVVLATADWRQSFTVWAHLPRRYNVLQGQKRRARSTSPLASISSRTPFSETTTSVAVTNIS